MKQIYCKILIYCLMPTWMLFQNCSQPIMINDISSNPTGYFMFGKGINRDFYIDKAIQDSLELKWEFETSGNQANTSVVILEKYLFVNDLSGRVYVIDKNTGKLFGYEKIGSSVSVTPILYGKRIFITTEQKEEDYSSFILFDLVNNKVLNEDRIKGAVISEMLKLENGIIVLSSTGELVRYNLIGNRMWSARTHGFTKSSPVSNGKNILFGNEKGELINIDEKYGNLVYRKKISGRIESGLTIDHSIVYFGDSNGILYAVQISTGDILWSYQTNSKIISIPVFNSAKIFIGNLSGNIYCLSKTEGSLIWKTETGGVINATPLLFKNLLVQPNLNKQVNLIDVSSGIIIKTIPFERRVRLSPVYYEGLIYLGADKGSIYAYKIFDKN
jgi:eukaryotic-like serine/threonine-protein kinase